MVATSLSFNCNVGRPLPPFSRHRLADVDGESHHLAGIDVGAACRVERFRSKGGRCVLDGVPARERICGKRVTGIILYRAAECI